MNCREACRAMTDFLEGTYPVSCQEEFLWHVENCTECREELAVTLTLQMALNSLDADTEFIYTDSDEGVRKVLDNAAVRVTHYNRYRRIKWAIGTVAGWALLLTCGLQIIYWIQTGFRLF